MYFFIYLVFSLLTNSRHSFNAFVVAFRYFSLYFNSCLTNAPILYSLKILESPILYHLKTPENQRFSVVFRGNKMVFSGVFREYEMGTYARNKFSKEQVRKFQKLSIYLVVKNKIFLTYQICIISRLLLIRNSNDCQHQIDQVEGPEEYNNKEVQDIPRT